MFEADKPAFFINYMSAGLVIITAENINRFSPAMFTNLLKRPGSGICFFIFIIFLGIMAVICLGISELTFAYKKLGDMKMKILNKLVVVTKFNKIKEGQMANNHVDILLASIESSGAQLYIGERENALDSDVFQSDKVKKFQVTYNILFTPPA